MTVWFKKSLKYLCWACESSVSYGSIRVFELRLTSVMLLRKAIRGLSWSTHSESSNLSTRWLVSLSMSVPSLASISN